MTWTTLPWITAPLLLPLTASLISLTSTRLRAWPSLLVSMLALPTLGALTWQVATDGPQHHALGGWGAPLGIELYADGLSVLLLWLTALVGGLTGVHALGYFRDRPRQGRGFWVLWPLLWTGLNALFLSRDIFNLYVTLEILTLAAVPLVALDGSARSAQAALHYLFYALLGSLSFLLGVALLYSRYGVLDLALLAEAIGPDPAAWLALALLTTGLLAKTAVAPLHAWLPPAHGGAPSPVSALLSALVVKGSFYLLLRLWVALTPESAVAGAGQVLGVLGAAAVLYGSAQALFTRRLKLLVAYSTVAQLGYLLLFFPLGSALAWGGVVYQILAHGLAKAALFLAAGNIIAVMGHDYLTRFRDLNRSLPLSLFAFALAGVGIMALPPSGGFVAKWLLLKAAVDSGQWWWALVLLIGGLLAAAYIFRVLWYAFAAPTAKANGVAPSHQAETHLPLAMELAPLGLALLALALAFVPMPLLALLDIGAPFPVGFWDPAWSGGLPALPLLVSFSTALIIFLLGEQRRRARTWLNLGGATLNLALVGLILWGVYQGVVYEVRLALLPGLDLELRVDAFSMLFATLSAGLWLVTTVYAVGYLEGSPHRARFFGFFSLCVAATQGVSMAGNLITFFIFYELLTLSTWPLVVHRGTRESLAAGVVYLRYTLTGSAVLLGGIIWLYSLTGTQDFTEGGVLAGAGLAGRELELWLIFLLLMGGFGVKAALVPLHGWLPQAMVAPAPVSALLHAVAVVKAGAFGIIRVVYDVYGVTFAQGLGVTTVLAGAAAVTIIYGSLRALAQNDLKRRLAFSTVSQVSYIMLGVAVAGPMATIGGIVHLVHQGLMKITLFFCAGNLAETLGVHKITELDGVGRRMPWTMAAFTLAALGMMGAPPLAGFISKWYLGLGGLEAGQDWVIPVLLASSLLNAAYFLPILHRAWFRPQPETWPRETYTGPLESKLSLLVPALITAALVLGVGVLAGAPFSPLEWAGLIAEREYRP